MFINCSTVIKERTKDGIPQILRDFAEYATHCSKCMRAKSVEYSAPVEEYSPITILIINPLPHQKQRNNSYWQFR